MSTYQNTTPSEKKQALLRSPYPHVFAYLQNRIAENEQKLLEATHLKATLHEDCSISGLVLEYHIDRLKVCIARDQKHLFEITVS
ncbi:MAG: hypothetical protein JNN25_08635 [Candidatus Kapabacteria bacterium]|nr:hypothetical protein [Candidatus Kapabacteria bacterium]